MPAQDAATGDQAMGPQCSGQPAARGQRARPDPPSPGVVGGCAEGWRHRAGARGARCPCRRMCGPSTRDVAALLALPAGHVVVGDDPIRAYDKVCGQLITWRTPTTPISSCVSFPRSAIPAPGEAPTCCSTPAPAAAATRAAGGCAGGGHQRTRRSRPLPTPPAAEPRSAPATPRVLRRPRPRTRLPVAITHHRHESQR